jgi:hypothetical protein
LKDLFKQKSLDMKKSLALLWGCLLFGSTLHAQFAPSGGIFGITLGFQQFTMRDEAATALAYKGNFPTLGLHWTNNAPNFLWEANLQGSYGKFAPENFPSRNLIFLERKLDGSIDTVLVQANGTHLMLKGDFGFYKKQSFGRSEDAFWATGLRVSEEVYYPQGFVSPGLSSVASLAPQAMVGFGNAEKGMFTMGIVIPIASLVTRLPYHQTVSQPEASSGTKSFFNYNTEIRSVNKHQEIKFRAGYQYRLSNHLIGGLHYEFAWLKDTDPRPLFMRSNTLVATVGFH